MEIKCRRIYVSRTVFEACCLLLLLRVCVMDSIIAFGCSFASTVRRSAHAGIYFMATSAAVVAMIFLLDAARTMSTVLLPFSPNYNGRRVRQRVSHAMRPLLPAVGVAALYDRIYGARRRL